MNSDDVREQWAEQSGEFSPGYYAYYGPDGTSEAVRGLLDAVVGPDAAVLELGCSSGRHLEHLREHGYGDLHGIDVNDEAFDVMEDTYPRLADEGTFRADTIENAVTEFADDRFDAVFSVETLQHLHPDHAWVFDELVRVTDDLLVTVENESGTEGSASGEDDGVNYVNDEFPLYYRNWRRIFTDRGFAEVAAESLDRDTLRAFRPADE